ncbi:MAG: YvaD family protein [Propionibacteriaceae bacterium]|nr:YvaD family protein [Propionibacteriaceae bacterium]
MRVAKVLLVAVDCGLLAYWLVTAFGWLPPDWAFKNYYDPLMVAWNWSFFPLDIAAALTGIVGVWRMRRDASRTRLVVISLTLTFVAGMMAIGFWALAGDFDPAWWIPNIALMVVPVVSAILLFGKRSGAPQADTSSAASRSV